ncbi:hypothetical protein [uncultured Mediterranean phage uvMED]|nr:hypothetical protein [uncultured Mediterranean phage uvMED]BAR17648.1 hypothetical protein [uncultured Mediterranean phage uvMED]BAR17699.1 hypothetical protein [uncultured Mediterranean phage uvMED]
MASKIKVDQIEGSTGSSITIPTGQTLTITDGLAASTIGSGTLADARIPNLNASKITAGALAVAQGGTGLTSLGSANQVVAVNSGASALEFQDASSGGIAQVVQTVKTSVQTIGSTSDVDIMNVQITPTSSSHKILVSWQISCAADDHADLTIVRDSTTIYLGDASGSRSRTAHGFYGNSQSDMIQTFCGTLLDSPSSTSQLTYYVKGSTPANSAHNLYINRSRNDADRAQNHRVASNIMVMEVTV